jgi:hypothetical protein
MAPQTKNKPRRSDRIKKLDVVSYVETRLYTRAAVVKKAPAKKASIKTTPAKKTPAKKTPAKETPAKKFSSSDIDDESEV